MTGPPPTDAVDRQGCLSVVVQGGLPVGALIQTALHCRHWRTLFPAAQIVLAVSSTDVLEGFQADGDIAGLRVVSPHRHDTQLLTALRALKTACDRIALSEGDLPLPPFKDDSGPNNFNLQRAAAQAGLALATGDYVLRIRSDAVFLTREFLQQHRMDCARPRGPVAVLDERVMISWLFTLNPYTVERLPLHFSDWFHFGAREDVRRLWDVPPVSLVDALHHRAYAHAPEANRRERQFVARRGIEQHLYFNALCAMIPGLSLEHLGDRSTLTLAMNALTDNFTICDLARARFFLAKYDQDLHQPERRLHCLTREDWLALVAARDAPPEKVLATKIAAAREQAPLFGL